jgi:hypothetical protein
MFKIVWETEEGDPFTTAYWAVFFNPEFYGKFVIKKKKKKIKIIYLILTINVNF